MTSTGNLELAAIQKLQAAAVATILLGAIALVLPLYAGFAATYLLAASFIIVA